MVSLSNHEAPFDSRSSKALAPTGNVCILTQAAFYIRLSTALNGAVPLYTALFTHHQYDIVPPKSPHEVMP